MATLSLSIHRPQTLSWFRGLAVVSAAAGNMGLQMPFQGPDLGSPGESPELGLPHRTLLSLCHPLKAPRCFPEQLYHFAFPPTPYKASKLQLPPQNIEAFENHHPDRCEVRAPCGLDVHFPN